MEATNLFLILLYAGYENKYIKPRSIIRKGYDIHMQDKKLCIKNASNNVIAHVEMSKNKIFILNIKTDVVKCLKSYIKDSSWLWHLRFGYLNFDDLNLWSSKKFHYPVTGH